MRLSEIDIIFLSYDEPNADVNYADLLTKAPWAKRVHGVKGSDAAHKAAAELSETDWFVTVDADNIVYPSFLDLDLNLSNPHIQVYSWCGKNVINGLRYGNGGLKVWSKDFVLNMKTHEESDSDNAQVDFCWETGYKTFPSVYSDTVITASPFQAWRAGFREGVKMTLKDGIQVSNQDLKDQVWWHNIHRLRMWSTVGMHEENGKYAILGARMGTWMANCTEWNYVDVRDFEILKNIYEQNVDHNSVEEDAKGLGDKIKLQLGLDWPWLDAQQSKFTLDLYNETFELCRTYYRER
jgi:hypothetical protein